MMNIDEAAQIIWEYMHVHQELKPAEVVLILGSIDEEVAKYGAKLFLQGYGEELAISGGMAHEDDLLKTDWKETEAEHFAAIAKNLGIPADKIILEKRATNTGENARFTHDLLAEKSIQAFSLLIVHKPYMERRTMATFEKQWPETKATFIVASPPITYEEYFETYADQKDKIINIMVGDLQRIKEYPKLGYQSKQYIPDDVWAAFEKLVKSGYTKHLIKTTS